MIRSLRDRHRVAAFLMAVGLPLLLLAALAVRPGASEGKRLPAELRPVPDPRIFPDTSTIHSPKRLGSLPVHLYLLRFEDGPPALMIRDSNAIGHPDVLLYWTADRNIDPESSGLPAGAKLVGALGKGGSYTYPLPPESVATDGTLVAYSLARQSVVGAVEWASARSAEGETAP